MKLPLSSIIGLITGVLMIAMSFFIYTLKGNFENNLQYITYSIYAFGIIATIVNYANKNPNETFGSYFLQGFKCFIVVTLLMVLFTAFFVLTHAELKEKAAEYAKNELTKAGNSTPKEIDEKYTMAKKSYLPAMLMAATFGYLIIGTFLTLIVSAFVSQKNKA